MKEGKSMKKKRNCIVIVVALSMCLVSMIGASLIQTNFGNVEITDVTIRTEVGTFTGYLFKPAAATNDNPAPGIVTSHGYLNNREMQDLNYVELARRGYVVFAMNAYSHGDSSVPDMKFAETINVQSGGMVDAVEYLSTLTFVDTSSIGVTGHSMGGGFANTTMEYYTMLERDAIANGMSYEQAHALNKVASGVIVGNYPGNLAEVADTSGQSGYLCDIGVIAGEYDEFFGYYAKTMLTSDMSRNVVAVQTGEILNDDLEQGKLYKNAANGYVVAMYQPKQFHAWNHFSTKTVGYLTTFFDSTIGAPNPLSSTNQLWWLKEAFNFIGLLGFFLFIVPFAGLLLKIPFFAGLAKDDITPLPPLVGKQKRRFAFSNILGGILSAIILVPAAMVGYLALINKFWPQDTTGGIGLWAAITGLIVWWMIRIGFGKKLKGSSSELGVKINKTELFKTILLAIFVVVGTYSIVFLADYLFKADFRLWTFCIRIFTPEKIWVAIKYLPLFALYYIFNSIAVNRSNFENWSEGKQITISALFNIIAPVIILVVTYIPVIWLGQTPWSQLPGIIAGAMALIPIMIIPFVPILAIAAYIGIKCYKLTGRIWLGALINTMMVTMITVANTSFSFPY